MSKSMTIVTARDGSVTKQSARDFRAKLRTLNLSSLAVNITGASSPFDVQLLADAVGLDVRFVPFSDLRPAEKGAITRKRNLRIAARAGKEG